MKINLKYIRCIAWLGILAIFALQLLWIGNMSHVVRDNWIEQIDQSLEYAINTEGAVRTKYRSEPFSIHYYPGKKDTAQIIKRTLRTEDTTVLIKYDKHDPTMSLKIIQFVFKNEDPLKPKDVDSLLVKNLLEKGYPVGKTAIEYIDIKHDTIISAYNTPPSRAGVYVTNTIPIDILDSVGVKAYVEIPFSGLLLKMIFQIILTALLLAVTGFCLVYLNRVIGRQKKKEEQEKDFISSMTHEFKRPISGATMMLSLIPEFLERGNIQKVKEYADRSLFELNKLSLYTKQIQEISKGEELAPNLDKEDIALKPFWEEVKTRYQSRTDKTEVKLDLQWNTVRSTISADLLHFSNVVDNLMENAFKYSGDQLYLEITLQDRKEYLQICVKDNGVGMSTFDSMHVFDKFYRSPSKDVQRKTGFGLGLTYVRSIIKAHSGRISVRSEIGKGSEFTILIPA